jgi:hypothetical protein
MERLRNQQFAYFGTVSVGGINEVYPELDSPTQNFPRVISIGRPTPYPLSRQAHRAKTKSIHRKIAAQEKRRTTPRLRGRRRRFLEHNERSSRQNGSSACESRAKKFSARYAVTY